MNARKSKLLRRWAIDAGSSAYSDAKTLWKNTPRTLRPKLSQAIVKQINKSKTN